MKSGYTFKLSDGTIFQLIPNDGANTVSKIGNENFYIEFNTKDSSFVLKSTDGQKTLSELPGITSFHPEEFDIEFSEQEKKESIGVLTKCASCSDGVSQIWICQSNCVIRFIGHS